MNIKLRMMGLILCSSLLFSAKQEEERLNIVLITADDMNWDSVGVYGCPVPDITPNIDRLASEGIRFENAHVTIAVCQPLRQVLMTGRYPHRNGGMGFEPIRNDVPTLQEQLRAAGYQNGIMGKVDHLMPVEKYCWNRVIDYSENRGRRSPKDYYKHALSFFNEMKKKSKPFFFMADARDPHRPFPGGRGWDQEVPREYTPEEVEVPGFLPDLSKVRREVAQYFTSVRRADESVGAVLRAVKDAGLEEKTLVVFLSDHGMAFPFSKTNVYLASTKTPLIVRWPGKIKSGSVDQEHLVSAIDFMPTILDAAKVKQIEGMDGRSFLPLLLGEAQEDREKVFTVLYKTVRRTEYPMRSVQDKRFGYIFNAWADGKTIFSNESQNGLTFKAMKKAAESDPKIAERVKLFQYRVPEEFFDYKNDPNALNNLIDDPQCQEKIQGMREALLNWMIQTNDPLTDTFKNRFKKKKPASF